MKVTLYLSTNKQREVEIGQALTDGFRRHGDEVETLPTEGYTQQKGDTQIAVMVGVKGKSKKIFEDHRKSARHTLLVDKSYFDRGDYYRLSLDGFQPRYAHQTPRSPERLEGFGVKFKPLRTTGKHIVYAGSSQKYCDWHDLGDQNEFGNATCFEINKRTRSQWPVYYRPKPSFAANYPDKVIVPKDTIFSKPNESFQSLLNNCHAIVTHGSNAAIEAIQNGIPAVLVSNEGASAAWPIAQHGMGDGGIDKPRFPTEDERRQVFSNLAWCQFSLDEMRAGLAWESLIPHTLKGMAQKKGMSDQGFVIEQYVRMHAGAKMFRGGSLKGHTEVMESLVANYKPASLLDYGSGKGAQYDDWKLHERWGGLRPTCYDPGYPPFATKPNSRFDGVICTDVAEHVPENALDDFLSDVVGYANKFAFFCIFTNPSRKFLPDGRNVHLTVRPPNWWVSRVAMVTQGAMVEEYMVRKALPGGAAEDFPHYVVKTANGVDVIVTFRGGDE